MSYGLTVCSYVNVSSPYQVKELGSVPEPIFEFLPGVMRVVIKATASRTGLTAIRLA